ncbi:MAG TPA: phosphotransferase [Mycobacteriales bacterium]|jgi:spectinomycin phosphotransferase|nr:phosphotransferase [Mycobacteriales bacterium]
MKSRPPGLDERDVAAALRAGWGLAVEAFEYLPVGFGGYHWLADGAWFVSVDDLDEKAWLGSARDEVFAGLSAALRTAAALAVDAVVAPVGEPVRRLADRWSVAVYPALTVLPEPVPPDDAQRVLAALHTAPAPSFTRVDEVAVPGTDAVRAALRALNERWDGGPFAEGARETLATHAGLVTRLLERIDATPPAPRDDWVVTHGEPHPGNLLATPAGPRLVDWDTVALAPPERDLWWLDSHDRYESLTGRAPDPARLDFYRARWDAADVASFTIRLRGPHPGDEDDADSLRYLRETLEHAAARAGTG